MNKSLVRLLVVALLSAITSFADAQSRIGIGNIYSYISQAGSFQSLSTNSFSTQYTISEIIDFYTRNPDFVVIDRQNLKMINDEKELQKSEDFMDGYIVEQGKSEGLDYFFYGRYDLYSKELTFVITDIKKGNPIGVSKRKVQSGFFGLKDFDKVLLSMLLELNESCFDYPISIVRATKTKGSKAKELLMAGGKNFQMLPKYEFDIYEKVEEKVGNKVLIRQSVIGKGKIIEVTDENFSILEVSNGDQAILNALNNKSGVYAKLIVE
jgi:hypothetical protein